MKCSNFFVYIKTNMNVALILTRDQNGNPNNDFNFQEYTNYYI